MQYSVSPRLTLISFGPKPSENVSTRTPMRRAIRKWPSSCTKMRTPRTNKKASTVNISPGGPGTGKSRDRLYSSRRPGRERPGPAVDFPDISKSRKTGDTRGAVQFVGVHGVPDHIGNAGERQPCLEKRRDRHFVGRVQHDREPFGPAQRPERQRQAGKPFRVGTLEIEASGPCQVERRQRRRPAIGIRKRI